MTDITRLRTKLDEVIHLLAGIDWHPSAEMEVARKVGTSIGRLHDCQTYLARIEAAEIAAARDMSEALNSSEGEYRPNHDIPSPPKDYIE